MRKSSREQSERGALHSEGSGYGAIPGYETSINDIQPGYSSSGQINPIHENGLYQRHMHNNQHAASMPALRWKRDLVEDLTLLSNSRHTGQYHQPKPFLPSIKTGRQRKKKAARSGDFKERVKRRIYFCCITSSVIDVEKLMENVQMDQSSTGWECRLFQEVLHMWLPGEEPDAHPPTENVYEGSAGLKIDGDYFEGVFESGNDGDSPRERERGGKVEQELQPDSEDSPGLRPESGSGDQRSSHSHRNASVREEDERNDAQSAWQLWARHAKECFVFGFGSIVLWGFESGEEEQEMVSKFRHFAVKQVLNRVEFEESEDDMAFTLRRSTSARGEAKDRLYGFHIENDVVDTPYSASVRQRLSLSFALAQSSILSVFEARIQNLVEEYRYIPETFAASGRVRLTAKQLGNMIGEVFVIRHDVNLNSEILDTPDWFWSQRDVEDLYKFVSEYLEMSGRTEILNKRLDMLKQLLDMLQAQHENAHAVKLEWIVIILIVISVLIELVTLALRCLSK